MIRRISILAAYFVKNFFFSLPGTIFLILSLVYWVLLFPPGQGTPDVENYIILVGAFGAAATFLVTLTIAARANRLENYPFITRLPSRIEYLAAILFSALFSGLLLQLLVAALALIRGPQLDGYHAILIPPLWLSLNILSAILALHATDLVANGWSRVIVFSLVAFLLILNSLSSSTNLWLSARLNDLATVAARLDLGQASNALLGLAARLEPTPLDRFSNLAGYVLWPFRAMADGVLADGFTTNQALAPAVLLLYATILFLLAASFFAAKDLDFVE